MRHPYVNHGARHAWNSTDPITGPWFTVGTVDVDGVNDELVKNPPGYRPDDIPGPPTFTTGTNGFALDADGNPGGPFRYRWAPHGIQLDCGGGVTGLSPGDVITRLIGVPLPTKAERILDADDATGAFIAQLLPSGDLVYIGPIDDGILDGGSP